MKFFGSNPLIFKALLRRYIPKITDNTVNYVKNGVYGAAEFVINVIWTVIATNKGPQVAGTRKLQNYSPLLPVYQ